ncbi:MAG: hypothetical protein AABY65_01580 [Nitrospirota bacterium]
MDIIEAEQPRIDRRRVLDFIQSRRTATASLYPNYIYLLRNLYLVKPVADFINECFSRKRQSMPE